MPKRENKKDFEALYELYEELVERYHEIKTFAENNGGDYFPDLYERSHFKFNLDNQLNLFTYGDRRMIIDWYLREIVRIEESVVDYERKKEEYIKEYSRDI